ncbi:MAG: outer membrane lipoprotein carrier protein LolA [Flavipsychrobacter sp.]|nr:outer membrane lipoprotein carrier protein LolA [Flavipsychrobacter sp.]
MKKILSVAIAALCLMTQPAMAQNDAKAKGILEAVSTKINGLKSLKANFALTMQGKTKETKKGSISMKGPKFRMTLDKTEIICDGKTQWTYMKDAKEVQVSTYNPAEQTLSPTKLFSGSYDKEYTYKHAGTRAVNGKNCDIVEMTPINKGKQFSKVELAIDSKTSTIVGGNVWEKNGNKYQYTISNFTPNPAVADSYFTFDKAKYPGVEVVDLR